MKTKTFEIKYSHINESYLNGEDTIHFLNSSGELITVNINIYPDDEEIINIFGEEALKEIEQEDTTKPKTEQTKQEAEK